MCQDPPSKKLISKQNGALPLKYAAQAAWTWLRRSLVGNQLKQLDNFLHIILDLKYKQGLQIKASITSFYQHQAHCFSRCVACIAVPSHVQAKLVQKRETVVQVCAWVAKRGSIVAPPWSSCNCGVPWGYGRKCSFLCPENTHILFPLTPRRLGVTVQNCVACELTLLATGIPRVVLIQQWKVGIFFQFDFVTL